MRVLSLLPVLFAALSSQATAQGFVDEYVPQFALGIQGDFSEWEPWAYSAVRAEGANFVMAVLEGWHHFAQDYATRGTPDGINVSLCGLEFPPFQPNPTMGQGEVIIPFGSPDLAETVVRLMSGALECDGFLAERAAAPDVDSASIVPPVSTTFEGLTIASPSDTRNAEPGDVLAASAIYDDTTGQYMVALTFGADFSAWVATETGEHIGEVIEISICNEVVTAPMVQEAISGGDIIISGNMTKSEAETQVAQIIGEFHCP